MDDAPTERLIEKRPDALAAPLSVAAVDRRLDDALRSIGARLPDMADEEDAWVTCVYGVRARALSRGAARR